MRCRSTIIFQYEYRSIRRATKPICQLPRPKVPLLVSEQYTGNKCVESSEEIYFLNIGPQSHILLTTPLSIQKFLALDQTGNSFIAVKPFPFISQFWCRTNYLVLQNKRKLSTEHIASVIHLISPPSCLPSRCPLPRAHPPFTHHLHLLPLPLHPQPSSHASLSLPAQEPPTAHHDPP